MKEQYVLSEDQKCYILNNWATMSIYKMKKNLNCPYSSIANFGEQNNLPRKQKKEWSKEHINFLHENASLMYVNDIADHLGKNYDTVYAYCRKHNIKFKTSRWNEEELKKLEDWGMKSIPTLEKNIGKSYIQIARKAKREKLLRFKDANLTLIKISDLSKMFDIHCNTIRTKWCKLGLKFYKQKVSNKTFYYGVKLEELLEFLFNNQDVWDSNKLEYGLLGEEPYWLKEKRKKDYNNPPKVKHNEWKTKEILRLKQLLKDGYSLKEVTHIMNRSYSSIKNKVNSLNIRMNSISCFDKISLSKLSSFLFVDSKKIFKKWNILGLNFHQRNMDAINTTSYVIVKDLKHFLSKNQNLWLYNDATDCLFSNEIWYAKKKEIDNSLKCGIENLNIYQIETIKELIDNGYKISKLVNFTNINSQNIKKLKKK